MPAYKIIVKLEVRRVKESYNDGPIISSSVEETVPDDREPVEYLDLRVQEEMQRRFTDVKLPVDGLDDK